MKFKVVEDSPITQDTTTELDEWMEKHELPTVINNEAEYTVCVGSAFALNPFDGKNDLYFATARHNVAPQFNKATKKLYILESLGISGSMKKQNMQVITFHVHW